MKKLLVFLIISVCGYGQNLIQNPSFEDYIQCPNGTITSNLNQYINFWSSFNLSMYYNRCSSDNLSVPHNTFVNSYQESHSGNAYAGVDLLNNYSINIKEYIQSELSQALQPGSCYFVELYTSLLNNVMYATNNLGLYFTNTSNIPLKAGYEYLLEGSPQIYKFGNPIISDTMNWVKVAGIYEAQGGEQFLTIGNFSTDEETDTMIFDPNAYDAAFYYIDDVSVIPIDASSMPANAGEDKTILQAESVFIGQEISNLNCTWSKLDGTIIGTNTSGLFVSPSETTTYVCEQNLCGVITYDTVTVFVGYLNLEPQAEALEVSGVRISPNPSSGKFTIELSGAIDAQEILVIDEVGRMVKLLDKKANKHYLELPKGIYFLEVKSKENRFCEKIVVN